MKYILIGDDGELHVKDGTYQQARAQVGSPGWDQVRLARTEGYAAWAGWVNGDGHRVGLPRNIVGGLVLTGMGAAIMPYAGPVVLTGWNPHGMPTEVCGLDDLQVDVIREIHDDARRAHAHRDHPDGRGVPRAHARPVMTHAQIAARLRELADREPTYIRRELYALAREVEETAAAGVPVPSSKISADDMEALVRATQPTRRRGLLSLLRGRP